MQPSKPTLALLSTLLLAATTSWGQTHSKVPATGDVYDARLLLREPDPALGNSSFKPSAQLRGLQGEDGIVYWLSADQKSITAYRGKQAIWGTNVAAALPKGVPAALAIQSMAWCSNALFFTVGTSGYVELDRQSGKVNQAGTD